MLLPPETAISLQLNISRYEEWSNSCELRTLQFEIDMETLSALAKSVRTVRQNIREYNVNNRRINVIAEGKIVNLAAVTDTLLRLWI